MQGYLEGKIKRSGFCRAFENSSSRDKSHTPVEGKTFPVYNFSDMTSSLGIAIVVSMVYLLAGGAVSLLAGRTWEKQLNSKAGCGSQKQDTQAGA